jgi:hypothetical protein
MEISTSMKNSLFSNILARVGNFLNAFKTPLLFWLYMMAVMAYAYGF